jgi:hypothetical protein
MRLSLTRRFITDTVESRRAYAAMLQICAPTFIMVAVTLGYITWRWSNFIVWDDTSSASYNMFSNSGHYSWDRIWPILVEMFANIQGDGYRPISGFIRGLGNAYVFSLGVNAQSFIIINGLLCGVTVLLYLDFARFFLNTRVALIFAAFLFFGSTPVLTGGLVLFSGVQFLVFIFLLLLVTIYLHHFNDARAFWLVPFGIALLIGPWVREMVGVAPAVILVHQTLYHRGIRPVGILAFLGLLHALFPTFLLSFFFHNLPVRSIFGMGNLGTFTHASPGGEGLRSLLHLHWRIFGDLFSILPPSLVLAGLIVICWSSWVYWRTASMDQLREQVFLLVFFVAAFLPFLKLFNEQVHLAYSLIPVTVLLAKQIEFLYKYVHKRQAEHVLLGVWLLLVVTTADHAVNFVAVRGATGAIYRTILALAERFTVAFPPRTIIISNAHHLEDIRFYSRGHIDPWAGVGGIPDRRRWLNSSEDLQTLLDNRKGRDLYFLDVRLPQRRGQRGAGRVLTFVHDEVVPMISLGRIAATNYIYPYFDPLRLVLPRTVATWPGPPDLEFDFYRGSALSGRPFLREVAVDYFLYKLTGDRVRRWMSNPVLLLENFHGFNVIGFRDGVYAIPQSEGAFDLARVSNGGYSRSFHGTDVEAVLNAVRRSLGLAQ